MSKLVRASLTAILVGVVCNTSASTTSDDQKELVLPQLTQEKHHKTAIKRIATSFVRTHYQTIKVNDELSEKVFDKFLKQLDFNRSIFIKSDVDDFQSYRLKFDDALKEGNLQQAYKMFQVNLERRKQRFDYAISLLETPMTFSEDDEYIYDREEAPWATSVEELNEIWRQKVKFEALSLKLAGKDWDSIKETVTKRYERALRRLGQTQSEDVFQTVMNAFSRSIEAHTSYLSPRNAERFQMDMNLSFEGIGAVLTPEEDFTAIRSVVPGGPADKSGKIKPKDKIVGVAQNEEDFVDVVGWRLDDVVQLIKGPKGTKVHLQVVKGDSSDNTSYQIVTLVRDKVKLEDRTAKYKVFESEETVHKGRKLGVIEIPSFYNNVSEDVKGLLSKLKEENVEGVIIDLRGNGGGSLREATSLSGLFFDSGPVVQIRNGIGQVQVNTDQDNQTYYDGPLTVLVDRYSASASEIFAAAMQDYGRGVIVGEQTFGKGTVQQHRGIARVYDSPDDPYGSIQYTIAKFYRIDGGSTQHKGVVPDISFPSAIVPEEWGESQEDNALPWDSIQKARYKTMGDLSGEITMVKGWHQERIQKNPEFQYIFEDIEEYKENKEKNTISLVEKERIAERDKAEQKRLERANQRLKRLGKDPVTTLEELPESVDFSNIDPFLNEAANITFDLIGLGTYAKK